MMDSQPVSKRRIGQNNSMLVTTRLYDKLLTYLTTLFFPKSSQVNTETQVPDSQLWDL